MAHIFVIAGHGAGDSGAVGNGYTEAERVRVLANKIKQFGGDNVTLGDLNRNYYADNGISSLIIPKDWQIIELHMDSASSSARGGHVIIKSGFSPDSYDNALANFIGKILPGRANLIVKRDDLANPNRAAIKGYGYRLVEVGFISNSTDINIFNTRMDEIAKGILSSFGINVSSAGWIKDNVGWWYRNSDGSYPKSCWQFINNKWYYFNSKGYALESEWVKDGDYWYYLTSDCSMAKGWVKDNNVWYYLNPSKSNKPEGAMLVGWQKINGYWYYLNNTSTKEHKYGDMLKGLIKDGEHSYYLRPEKEGNKPEGSMLTGWKLIDNEWYYFNVKLNCQPEGSMLKNHWITDSNKKYYLKDDGKMAKDESIKISGKTYSFNNSGEMV